MGKDFSWGAPVIPDGWYVLSVEGKNIVSTIMITFSVVYDDGNDNLISRLDQDQDDKIPQLILKDEIKQWLEENLKGGMISYPPNTMCFELEEDAALFKLTWF